MKNVYFSYNSNQKNIKDFCLNLEHGEKVALVGKTGSGKTTITSLLCRFYEPIKGEILINNKNYKKYKISSLRKRIGYVMQEVEIFPNTIIDNIKYINKDIYNNPDILSTRRKTINKFCKNNGNRHRCNYFR